MNNNNPELYRILVQSVKDYAIFMLDPNGIIISWNSGAQYIKGYKEHEIIGKHFSVFYTQADKDRNHPDNELKIAVAEGRYEDEGWRIRKDGTQFWANVVITTLYDDVGNIKGYAKVTRDLTDRKQKEDALLAAEKSYAANLAKSDFLANMSHEIRTPMNTVIGMTELLFHTTLTDEQRENVTAIYQAGNILLTVIDDILDFSKIEAGELSLQNSIISINAALEEIISFFKIRAEQNYVTLKMMSFAHLPLVIGDSIRLRQILMNLVSNAVKFTHHGSVTIKLTHERISNETLSILFEVTDTGIGIPADKIERLFHKFSQVEAFTHKRYGGTGLGLAISKQLTELMGGDIGVISEEGKGSTFWCRIPFQITNQTQVAPVKNPIDSLATATAKITKQFKAHILVAEDYFPNQHLERKLLEKLGCIVDIAEDGLVAVKKYNENHYDLILMDCQMPEMDGYEATSTIRNNEQHAASPSPAIIVAMTANALEGDREKCIAAGMDDYIAKPVRLSELQRVLQKYLVYEMQ